MGYTHYLKSDEALSAGQARACGEACMAFLALVPDAVLARALAHPGDLERRGLEEQAQANAAILERDVKGLRHFLRRRNLGFLCMPQDTESFAVRPDTDWMCCKTVDPGTEADSLVVCLHVASQEALREADRHVLRFESDGCFEDLEAGLALWEDCTGAPAPHLPFVEGTRSRLDQRPYMGLRIETAQLLWDVLRTQSGAQGPFEAAGRLIGIDGLRGRARHPAVLDACLEGWREARSAGFAGGFALDFLPVFASACLDRRDAGLKEGWRECLGSWLAEAPAPSGAA